MSLLVLLKPILFYGSAFICSFLLSVCVFIIATTRTFPLIKRSKSEKCFFNHQENKKEEFPSIDEEASLHLSIVIPAYNEETRLIPMLEECLEYLRGRSDLQWEIIVVSDGSTDNTAAVANDYSKQLGSNKVRLLNLEQNRGKGGAVQMGVLSARGALILFADADGATKFSDYEKLEGELLKLVNASVADILTKNSKVGQSSAVVIGSRAHLEKTSIAQRSLFRTILMYGFHLLVWLFAVRGIKDTQCGFKLFTRKAARKCFKSLHVERWAFDVELLYIAQKLRIPIAEISVNWTEIDGSKIVPLWSALQMGRDLCLIWLRYTIGAWKISAMEDNNKSK